MPTGFEAVLPWPDQTVAFLGRYRRYALAHALREGAYAPGCGVRCAHDPGPAERRVAHLRAARCKIGSWFPAKISSSAQGRMISEETAANRLIQNQGGRAAGDRANRFLKRSQEPCKNWQGSTGLASQPRPHRGEPDLSERWHDFRATLFLNGNGCSAALAFECPAGKRCERSDHSHQRLMRCEHREAVWRSTLAGGGRLGSRATSGSARAARQRGRSAARGSQVVCQQP